MRRRPRSLSGWTLIELLVVMGMIGILAGLLLPAANAIYERARKAQAKNDLTQILSAVNAFYTDYGSYPNPTAATANVIYGPAGAASGVLFNELQACHLVNGVMTPSCCSAADTLNLRQIAYISPPCWGTPTARSGIGSDGQYYDPWGTPYNIEINFAYDNQIANPYPDTTPPNAAAGAPFLSFGVIGWSYGKDRTPGTKSPASPNYGSSDDVISWQ
jgi:prepilin-type N-terminal cleavage/methylation domain-containing protein